MAQVKSEDNHVQIRMGQDHLVRYREKLSGNLRKFGVAKPIREKIINELDGLIEKNTPSQSTKLTTPIDNMVRKRWARGPQI